MKTAHAQHIQEDCLFVLKERVDRLSALRNSTLVMTGGTGFFGKWIGETLACLNDHFGFGVRAHFLSRQASAETEPPAHLAARSDFHYERRDVRYPFEVPKETNWFIHAAGDPNTRRHASEPTEVMTSIAKGTENALRSLDRCGDFRMFLNLSSGLVYGSQPWELERMPETFRGAPDPTSSTSSYAEAKRFGEALCAAARSQLRIPALNVRPFAFLGPYQSLEGPWAVANFLHDALSGSAIRIFGDGKTVRSYLYGADAAFWTLAMLTGGKNGGCYNLGNPEGLPLESLAELIASSIQPRPESRLSTAPSRFPHRSRFVPDTKLAETELGLVPLYSLKSAVERTLRWHQTKR